MDEIKSWVLVMCSAAFFCLMVTTAYYKQNGLRDVQKLHASIEKVRAEIKETAESNDRYVREISSLRNSDTYVESIARESLGLVKPGDVVYEFVDADKLARSVDSKVPTLAER